MRSDDWMKAWCAAAMLLTVGCTRTVREASVADTLSAADATTELDFWDELSMQDAVTNHDALHALMLTFGFLTEDGADDEGVEGGDLDDAGPAGFDAKVAFAQQRGWIGADEALIANETAQVGWIARAICLEAGVEGGLSMHLFGPIPRYALRELTYERIMPTKSENQALSGLELIATVSRVQDRRTGLVSAPRQEF